MEQANIVTDPLLQSWKAAGGYEVTDLCRNVYGNTVGEPLDGTGISRPENGSRLPVERDRRRRPLLHQQRLEPLRATTASAGVGVRPALHRAESGQRR